MRSIEAFKNQKILLFGKPRAFDVHEFAMQLEAFCITFAQSYEEDVACIVEGRLLTPYEQNEFDRLYALGLKEKFLCIDDFEKLLIANIEPDTLLMSLKLSHDRNRLFAYLKNSQIDDTLFLKLLKLYDWQGEGFFDTDANRDITAALISRFYTNIEQNHNVQYATLGLMHLVEQRCEGELIASIAALAPLKNGFEQPSLFAILHAIAKNAATPENVLKMFLKNGSFAIQQSIAARKNLSVPLQNLIFLQNDPLLCETLCKNENITPALIEKLQENYASILAQFVQLDGAYFELFLLKSPLTLALNTSLTCKQQERLSALVRQDVTQALAKNEALCERVAQILLACDDGIKTLLFANPALSEVHLREAYAMPQYHLALAQNPATPAEILEKLGSLGEFAVLQALCKNPNTPIATLYELRLDLRLDRLVSENERFGAHIKTENIGWKI